MMDPFNLFVAECFLVSADGATNGQLEIGVAFHGVETMHFHLIV